MWLSSLSSGSPLSQQGVPFPSTLFSLPELQRGILLLVEVERIFFYHQLHGHMSLLDRLNAAGYHDDLQSMRWIKQLRFPREDIQCEAKEYLYFENTALSRAVLFLF